MEKNIITFQANEQELINTTPKMFASDTVSYIEARFELGENWSGFDSVRAIWSNGYERISTVLNSLGVCIVPTEVLTRRADVLMNLVGSIAENGELTDRLTTFPVIALRVTKKAMVEGTETAPVTPSQFEQFAEAVRQDADRAEAGASEAEGYRDEALQIKSDVQGLKADVVQLKADTEQLKDDTASIKADVEALADGFDDTVADAVEEITTLADTKKGEITSLGDDKKTEISSLADSKKAEITQEGTTQKGLVSAEGTTQLNAIRTEGSSQLSAIRTEGTTQKGLVTTEGQTQVANVQAEGQTQIDAIQTEGEEQIQAIEDKGQEVISLIPYMAPVIVDTASGDIASFTDGADDYPIKSLKVSLEPKQSGTGDSSPSNVRPISGWSGVEVNAKPLNLFPNTLNVQSVTKNGVTFDITEENGFITDIYMHGTASAATSLAFANEDNPYNLPAGSLKMYLGGDRISSNSRFDLNVRRVGSTKDIVATTGVATITNTEPTQFGSAYIWVYSGAVLNHHIMPCILKDDADTTGYPKFPIHNGQSHSITLPSTVYGGEIDVVSGEGENDLIYIEYDGTEEVWRASTSYVGSFYLADSRIEAEGTIYCCSHLTPASSLYGYSFGKCVIDGGRKPFNINLYLFDQATTLEDFKAYLADQKQRGTPVCVAYRRPTPTPIYCEPTEIKTLKGNNTIWSDGEVSVEYCADTKLYIDKKLG